MCLKGFVAAADGQSYKATYPISEIAVVSLSLAELKVERVMPFCYFQNGNSCVTN